MTPFFFGRKTRRLYGVYHPATQHAGTARAVVLCYPWGPEYIQSHRSFRVLADMLAAAGLHTLRFDYYGTGDSGGELLDGDVFGWRDDVLTAIEELRDISGASVVSLVGLRFGATIAALAAQSSPADISEVVLWDPVASASEHLNDFGHFALRHAQHRLLPVSLGGAVGGQEVFGYPISTAFRREADALELQRIAATLMGPLHLVTSGEPKSFERMVALLPPTGLHRAIHVPAPPCWDQSISFLPRTVLSAIVQAFDAPA